MSPEFYVSDRGIFGPVAGFLIVIDYPIAGRPGSGSHG